MVPARSVRNIRFPLKSRAIPIPSIRCVSKTSGVGCLVKSASVAARRISAIGPINEPTLQIELEIDRFRQTVEQKFDISAVRSDLALRDVDLYAEDSPFARIVRSFLGPVNLSAVRIDGDADAPFC